MLSPIIKKRLEEKYGAPIRYAKDCEALAGSIRKVCKCQISGSTVKRLLGIIKGTETPRLWTLDLVAFYLGYGSYNELIAEITESKTTKKERIESLNSKELKKGSIHKIDCGKSSSLLIENLDKGHFLLLEQKKTILLPDDVLEIEKIQMHYPVIIKSIKRNEAYHDGIIIGNVTGVTSIAEIKTISSRKSKQLLNHNN
jgi:hypothetical protein